MTPKLAELLEAGLALSPADRLELAHQMNLSVDDASSVDRESVAVAWRQEIETRVDDLVKGSVQTVPFSATYERLSAKIAAARP